MFKRINKKIIDFEKKWNVMFNKKELKLQQDVRECYISRKRLVKKLKYQNHWKVRDHCHS